MNDVRILLEIKEKLDRGEYDSSTDNHTNTEHKIEPMLIIPVETLDKIILDALRKKEIR